MKLNLMRGCALRRPAPGGMILLLTAGAGAAALLAALLSFFIPAGAALFAASGSDSPAGGAPGVGFSRLCSALGFTLLQALLSSLTAMALGVPAAFLTARREFPGRRLLLSLSGIPLCIPPIIIALAFVLFYGRQGYLNTALMRIFRLEEPPVTFLYSLSGVVLAHGLYNFPVVLRTVSRVWERLPASEEEAAVLLGASPFRKFRTVTFPHLAGAVLSSSVLVFLYCFFSFVIVLLFGGVGGTTLEVELYLAIRAGFDYRAAGWIAVVETVSALGIVFAYQSIQKKLSEGASGFRNPAKRTAFASRTEKTLAVVFLAAIAVFFLGPLLLVVARSFSFFPGGQYTGRSAASLTAWKTLLFRPAFAPSLFATIGTAAAVAVVSAAAGTFFAVWERVSPRRLLSMLPLAPLAVSSVMLGFGWRLLVPRGSVWMLVCAGSALAWPFAWTQIRAAIDRIPPSVMDAALLLSKSPLEAHARVTLPLAAKGILSGAALVFAISAGDATLPLVLSIPKFENLPLMLYRLVGSYRFAEACACAVLLALLSGFVFFLQDSEGFESPGEE